MSAGFKYYGKRARDLEKGQQFKFRSHSGILTDVVKEGRIVRLTYDDVTFEVSLDAKVQVMALSLGF